MRCVGSCVWGPPQRRARSLRGPHRPPPPSVYFHRPCRSFPPRGPVIRRHPFHRRSLISTVLITFRALPAGQSRPFAFGEISGQIKREMGINRGPLAGTGPRVQSSSRLRSLRPSLTTSRLGSAFRFELRDASYWILISFWKRVGRGRGRLG